MTLVMKAAFICDGCGARADVCAADAQAMKFSPSRLRDTPLEGWREPKAGKHLCPECADAYAEKEREMQRQLDEMLGVEKIEFDL